MSDTPTTPVEREHEQRLADLIAGGATRAEIAAAAKAIARDAGPLQSAAMSDTPTTPDPADPDAPADPDGPDDPDV